MTYLVAGNNIFGQWFSGIPILEKFQKINDKCLLLDDFNVNNAELVCICWSYNIYKFKQAFYVTGDWVTSENNIKKIDGIKLFQSDISNLLLIGNDFKLFIIDNKKLKIWTLNITEKLDVYIDPKELYEINECAKNQVTNRQIVKAITTNTSFLCLTNDGFVYHGTLPSLLDTSHCIGEVCDIVCGYNHFILLTNVGRIYTWGSSERLQLGHGDIECVNTPTEVEALAGLKINKIAAGGFHSLALSEYGDVYGWGWNDTGQLGIPGSIQSDTSPSSNKSYPLPTLIDIFDETGKQIETDVVDIACGSRHSVIKLADNTLWTSGCNKYGQLGFSPDTHLMSENFKKALHCDFDYKLQCGIWTTVLVRTK